MMGLTMIAHEVQQPDYELAFLWGFRGPQMPLLCFKEGAVRLGLEQKGHKVLPLPTLYDSMASHVKQKIDVGAGAQGPLFPGSMPQVF